MAIKINAFIYIINHNILEKSKQKNLCDRDYKSKLIKCEFAY